MCRGFKSRLPLVGASICADVAQSVERVLGKDEVTGSIPVVGSILFFGSVESNEMSDYYAKRYCDVGVR